MARSDDLMIFPNLAFFFEKPGDDPVGPFEVVHQFVLGDGLARVYISRIGAFGFLFDKRGPLGSEGVLDGELEPGGSTAISLEERRLSLANFVAAAIFGRHAGRTERPLVGAYYSGLDAAFSFGLTGLMRSGRVYDDGLSIEDFGDDLNMGIAGEGIERFMGGSKIQKYLQGDKREMYISLEALRSYTTYVNGLIFRSKMFRDADLPSVMRMNYQALVLHDHQHPEASLALNAVVIETLVSEIFFAYGLVGNHQPRTFATRPHHAARVSKTAFKDMRLVDRVEHLKNGGLIETRLFERIDTIRLARNALMHKGEAVNLRRSVEAQGAARDLWSLLIDPPFALIAKPPRKQSTR